MKPIELTEGLELASLLETVQEEDLILTREGHAVALLSEIDDEELYWYRREQDPAFVGSIAQARQQVRDGQVVSHEDVKRELGIA